MRQSIKRLIPPPIAGALADAKLTKVSQRPDAVRVSKITLQSMIDLVALAPSDKVLDVGCGYGRIALPLTTYLSAEGSYDGFDILPGEIEWATKHITKQFPNFRFLLADIHNKYYNIAGTMTAREYRFPYADGAFDVVCLHSVFTHLMRQDLEHYLSEIARVLKPGGRTHITYFLINDERADRRVKYAHERNGCRILDPERPEWEVAYEEADIRALYPLYGLKIRDPIHFGFQDIVVGVKS